MCLMMLLYQRLLSLFIQAPKGIYLLLYMKLHQFVGNKIEK